jgi:hypothetical protein
MAFPIQNGFIVKIHKFRNDHARLKKRHEVCNYLPKDNTMSANTTSYFAFHIAAAGDDSPKPGPEWPPIEPSPIPPTTDPFPTVPPVTGAHFQLYFFMLN